MEYVYIGKITSTHGIKGEIKIKSSFKYKEQVFKLNNNIYIGKTYQEFKITSYRKHKGFDMITINNICDINDVLKYLKENVYFKRDDLKNINYLNEELIGLNISYHKKIIGKVIDIIDAGSGNLLLKLEKFYIPLNDHFIKSVFLDKKIIEVENIEGLML